MKKFRLAVAILALVSSNSFISFVRIHTMNNFVIFNLLLSPQIFTMGDCTPNDQPKGKKIRFKDTFDFDAIYPSDVPDGVFVMNYKTFNENVQKKYKLYDRMSKEYKFIQFLSIVVEKTYLMWDQMYRAVNLFNSYEVILTQTERVYKGETMFPDPKTFENLENYKKYFKETLALILSSIEPAYEINEVLIPLVDRMHSNTTIDGTLLQQMFAEVKDVISIFNKFDDASECAFSLRPITFFTTTSKDSATKKDCEKKVTEKQSVMKMYRISLNEIRVIVIQLECQNIHFNAARAELKKNINMLEEKIYPKIEKSLNYAKQINFTRLHEAMGTIRNLARRALSIED